MKKKRNKSSNLAASKKVSFWLPSTADPWNNRSSWGLCASIYWWEFTCRLNFFIFYYTFLFNLLRHFECRLSLMI